MKIANSTQNNLAYQKQLLSTLDKIVSFRTELVKNAVIIANEGKDKEWPNLNSQIKFLRKNVDSTEDNNLKTISEILRGIEKPILELEKNLELKNNFLHIISEQTLIPVPEEQAV